MFINRNETKEKSVKYIKCMFVNDRGMHLYIVHVLVHGSFKCRILLHVMYKVV